MRARTGWILIGLTLLVLAGIRIGQGTRSRPTATAIEPPMECPAGANCTATLPDGRRCWLWQHGRHASAHPEWKCEQ